MLQLGTAGAALVAPLLESGWHAASRGAARDRTESGRRNRFPDHRPATNLSTLGELGGPHGRTSAIAFAGALVAFAIAAGIAIDFAFTSLYIPYLGALTDTSPTAQQLLCLAGLLVLISASVARRGIRRFAAEIREGLGWNHDHEHGHEHEHEHEHSHGHSHDSSHHHG